MTSLRAEVDRLKRGQRTSQLGSSSVEDGYLSFNDAYGIQRVTIGRQVDGKFGWGAVNGDAPPRPTPATLTPGPNGLTIGWDGQFVGPAPSDFVHVKAYLSPVGANFIRSDGNCVGHLLGNARLPINPLPQTGHWCVLVAYNTSGVASEPSIVAGPVVPGAVVATEILDGIVTDLKLADGAVSRAKIAVGAVGTAQIGNQQVDLSKLANGSVDATKIVDGSITPAKVTFTAQDIGSVATYNQASAPSGTVPQGSLWFDGSKLRRYAGSSWFELTDAGIANALSAAQQAQTDAANALTTASGAQSAVNSKVTVFYQGTAPSGANTGDLWLNTAANNSLQRWSGSAWVPVSDTRIATALANAQTAQATADGKITAFYQATAPASGMAVGDFWYKSDAGNLPHRWNGTTWVPLPLGSAAIADNSIVAAKLANGSVTLGKLADGSVPGTAVVTDAITADKIATGAVGSGELATGSVIAGKVAAGAIGTNELAANSVVAGKVAANTIGANEIIANSIVAGKLAADSVTATNIVAGSVQTSHIAAEAVSAGKIAAASVTAEKIAALAVTADKISANSIAAGMIQSGAITADKLQAILVMASTIIAGDPTAMHLELGDAQTPILYWDNNKTGFALSQDPVTGQSNAYLSGRIEFGNGSQIEQDYLDLCEQVSSGFQTPTPRQSPTRIYSEPVASIAPKWQSATGKSNLLLCSVLAANPGGNGAPTITGLSGWTAVPGGTVTGGASGSTRLQLFYIPASQVSRATETINATLGGSPVSCSWSVGLVEYAGLVSSPLDRVVANSGTGTAATSGATAATTQANELQVAVFGTPGAGTSQNKSGFSGFTNSFKPVTEGGGYKGQGSVMVARNATGTAAVTASATVTPSNPWLAVVATFKTAAAAPVPAAPPTSVTRLFTLRRGGKSTPHVVDDGGAVYPLGRVPYCKVRLNAPSASTPNGQRGGVLLSAQTDVYAQGDWVIDSGSDPYGMASLSTSAGTWSRIDISISGLYYIDFTPRFQSSTATEQTCVGFVTRNGRDRTTDSVASDSQTFKRYGGDLTPVRAARLYPLTAGDQLFWGTWANTSAWFYNSVLGINTEITVMFMGPLAT